MPDGKLVADVAQIDRHAFCPIGRQKNFTIKALAIACSQNAAIGRSQFYRRSIRGNIFKPDDKVGIFGR